MRRLIVVLLVALALTVSVISGARLERMTGLDRPGQDLLYLPNGKFLKVASLGQAPVLADMLYLWAIQFYSDYDREDRFLYVEHVFGEVIAELDPHYVDPYLLGAMILAVEADDLEAAMRLLDQGFANNPDEWWLPFQAGWECYHAGQYRRAREYFNIAAEVPGAPPTVRRMIAGMAFKEGELRLAIRLWHEVLENPNSDELSIGVARGQIDRLTVAADVQELQRVVTLFRNENRRFPRSLAELLSSSYIDRLPKDPSGRPYHYDRQTGRVSSARERVLGDD